MSMRLLLSFLVLGSLTQLAPGQVSAADTVETWAVGPTDAEFHFGSRGLGLDSTERNVFGAAQFGYGIIPRFSAYVGTVLEGNGDMASGGSNMFLGVFGTPLDTDHVDLDLLLHAETTHPSDFAVSPALELNLDLEPDLALAGLYLRAGLPILARGATPPHADTNTSGVDLQVTAGVYWTVAPSHQILLEVENCVHLDGVDSLGTQEADGKGPTRGGASAAAEEGRRWDAPAVAVGYNVTVHPSIEILSEIRWTTPKDAEPSSYEVLCGFIATLPSSR